MALTDKLTAIADAIRGKTGGTDTLTLDQMAEAIAAIEAGGGGDVPDALFAVYLYPGGDYDPSWCYTEYFPFKTGMTWREYAESGLCPYRSSSGYGNDAVFPVVIDLSNNEDYSGPISYTWYCFEDFCVRPNYYYLADGNGDLVDWNDPIQPCDFDAGGSKYMTLPWSEV